jgi:hypothetical protein
MRRIGVAGLAVVVFLLAVASAQAAGVVDLSKEAGAPPLAKGTPVEAIVDVTRNGQPCQVYGQGTLKSNGKAKDTLSFSGSSTRCFGEGTITGTLSKVHVSAGLMTFAAKVTVTYSEGCTYAFKAESGSFAFPGPTSFEHGTATGKLDRKLSKGVCAKTITDQLVEAVYATGAGQLYASEG